MSAKPLEIYYLLDVVSTLSLQHFINSNISECRWNLGTVDVLYYGGQVEMVRLWFREHVVPKQLSYLLVLADCLKGVSLF